METAGGYLCTHMHERIHTCGRIHVDPITDVLKTY